MQIVQSHQPAPSKHLLVDEIYAPSLSTPAGKLADAQASLEAQHMKATNELHRFLESSCDCV